MCYKIITDTSCNLPLSRLAGADIDIIPFTYYDRNDADHQMHCIDIDRFDGQKYYDAIRKGVRYNTSQITPQIFYDHIAPFARAGQDVLFISMSSGISGSYNSSLAARDMLSKDFPDRSFYMLDTMAASLGEGIAVLKAIEYRAQGMTISECHQALTALCRRICQVFTVEDLRHLQRTGRISNVAALLGTVLRIQPILKGNELGQIVSIGKVRGSRSAIRALADKYNALVRDPQDQIVGIAHADNPEGAEALKKLICAQRPPREVLTVCYEPVTGAHVGSGTVALFFLGDDDVRSR